jgi:hypothetical protein
MADDLSVKSCQERLAIAWILSSGVLFGVLLLQTFHGRFESQGIVWGWAFSAISPCLAAVTAAIFGKTRSRGRVDAFAYRLAMFISVAYLVVVFTHILVISQSVMSPTAMVTHSSLYLPAFQGIVALALGRFFGKKGA